MSLLQRFAEVQVQCFNDTCETGLPKVDAGDASVQIILQLTFGIIGAIAVIMVMIAGFKFVTSAGNPQSAASARKTAIFALLGLAVAVSAEVIVTFFLKGL